jgi:hypothetical protein
MVLLAHGEPSVRPDDVVTALRQLDEAAASPDARFTRRAQGRLLGQAPGCITLRYAGGTLLLPPGEDDPTSAF